MARHVAKNIVAAKLADRCEVQLAYAIGVAEPVSVHIDTDGTGRLDDARICELVRDLFPLKPGKIIEYLDLRRPIYRLTAAGGHFGRSEPEFTWESTQRAAELAEGRRQRSRGSLARRRLASATDRTENRPHGSAVEHRPDGRPDCCRRWYSVSFYRRW